MNYTVHQHGLSGGELHRAVNWTFRLLITQGINMGCLLVNYRGHMSVGVLHRTPLCVLC